MTGAQVKVAFTDMFPPAVLFSEEFRSVPAIYANIRDWLNLKGAALTLHCSCRILITLAHSLYKDVEDRVPATEISLIIFSQGRQFPHSITSEASGTAGPSGAV